MDKAQCFSTNHVISIAHFRIERNGALQIIHGQEIQHCPVCDGELFCRGTCHRKTQNAYGETAEYQLRVMQCRDCKKTLRKLPSPIVPYKRYDAEAIMHIRDNPKESACEPNVRIRMITWLVWFIRYASHIQESQSQILSVSLPKVSDKITSSELSRLIRIVVNSQNWLYNRTVWAVT